MRRRWRERSVSAATAMESTRGSPSDTALKIATRSAQTGQPSVAFSTLQPANYFPDLARTAAPTRKFEMARVRFRAPPSLPAIKAS